MSLAHGTTQQSPERAPHQAGPMAADEPIDQTWSSEAFSSHVRRCHKVPTGDTQGPHVSEQWEASLTAGNSAAFWSFSWTGDWVLLDRAIRNGEPPALAWTSVLTPDADSGPPWGTGPTETYRDASRADRVEARQPPVFVSSGLGSSSSRRRLKIG